MFCNVADLFSLPSKQSQSFGCIIVIARDRIILPLRPPFFSASRMMFDMAQLYGNILLLDINNDIYDTCWHFFCSSSSFAFYFYKVLFILLTRIWQKLVSHIFHFLSFIFDIAQSISFTSLMHKYGNNHFTICVIHL